MHTKILLIILVFGLSWQLNANASSIEAGAEISNALASDSSYQTFKTNHFNVIHDISVDEAKKIAGTLEFSYSEFQSVFSGYGFKVHSPKNELVWICFKDTASFNNYVWTTEKMDLSWLTGYYSAKTNAVALVKPGKVAKAENSGNHAAHIMAWANNATDVGLVEVIHEAAHQLSFNTGLQKRGVMYPIWAGEGPALIFEDSLSKYLPVEPYSTIRKKRLARLYQNDKLIPLDEFLCLTNIPATVSNIDVYSQAYVFFYFLCENRKEDLQKYFSNLSEGRQGWRGKNEMLRELTEAFGSLEQLNIQWSKFLKIYLSQ